MEKQEGGNFILLYGKFCHPTGCRKPGLKGSIGNNYWCFLVWNPVFWTDDSSTENTNITWAVNHYSVYSEFSCLNGQCIVLFHLNIKVSTNFRIALAQNALPRIFTDTKDAVCIKMEFSLIHFFSPFAYFISSASPHPFFYVLLSVSVSSSSLIPWCNSF